MEQDAHVEGNAKAKLLGSSVSSFLYYDDMIGIPSYRHLGR